MEQETKQVTKAAGILGILSANWATILILVLLVLSGIRMITTQDRTIELLTKSNEVYASSYDSLRKSMDDLRLRMEENNRNLAEHYTRINRNMSVSESRISLLEKAADREKTVEAKPGLVTIKAKKAIKENEENFSCLTGNTEYCSSSPAQ